MASTTSSFSLSIAFRTRHIALPNEHGAWVFLFSPLLIGLFTGGFRPASWLLVLAVLATFLIRQPVIMAVKVRVGRRPRRDIVNITFWLVVYGLIASVALASLASAGHGYLAMLALPALPVFGWHLWLVGRRAERRQLLVEILGAGVLALSAPAAYWVGQGQVDTTGWLLWSLAWLQAAGTILYAYLRLQQRTMAAAPDSWEALKMARFAMIYNITLFGLVAALSASGIISPLLLLAYAIQPIEVIWGAFHPAVGIKPKAIGIRQLIISALFTLAFILTW